MGKSEMEALVMDEEEQGYLRVSHAKTVDEYLKGEKRWAWAMIAVAVVFIVFATYYNIAVRPGVLAG